MTTILQGVGGRVQFNRGIWAGSFVEANTDVVSPSAVTTAPTGWTLKDDIAGTPLCQGMGGYWHLAGIASAGAGTVALTQGDSLWGTTTRGARISAQIKSGTGTAGMDTALDSMMVALISAYNSTITSCTNRLVIAARQESGYWCYSTDDGTTDSGWVVTTVPWVAGTDYFIDIYMEADNGFNDVRYAYGFVNGDQIFRIDASLITGGLQGAVYLTRANNDELTAMDVYYLCTSAAGVNG